MAAQYQTLRTNRVKKLIDNQNVSRALRMWGERVETVSHVIAALHSIRNNTHKEPTLLFVTCKWKLNE